MKTINRTATGAIAALLLLGTAACGSGYDRQEAIDDLVESGMTDQQATCMVDRLEESIGTERLGERGVEESDLTEEETQLILDATTDCVLGG